MKTILIAVTCILLLGEKNLCAQSQSTALPNTTEIKHYQIEIGYNTTTVLLFPAKVNKDGDVGSKELIVQKQKGVDNALKIKAAHRNFPQTNLHVFTSDNKMYSFDIVYAELPGHTTFDLSKLDVENGITVSETTILPIDEKDISSLINKTKKAKSFFSSSVKKDMMKLRLRTIHIQDGMIFIGLELKNNSSISFPIDFIRMYIRDRITAKRSSVQQHEITPIYKDTLSVVPSKSKIEYTVVVNQFTIPDRKQFMLEVYEQNGGRNISLLIRNRQIFKARKI